MNKYKILIIIILIVWTSCVTSSPKKSTDTCLEVRILYNDFLLNYNLGRRVYSPKYPVVHYANGTTSKIVLNEEINSLRKVLGFLPDTYSIDDSTFTLTDDYLLKIKNWLIANNCAKDTKNTYFIYNSDTLNRIDENGNRQGEWISIDKDQKHIIARGHFINDLRHGTFIKYYKTGEVYKTVEFSKDRKIENSAKTFFKTGKLMSEVFLDSLNNNVVVFYNKKGVRIREFPIVAALDSEFALLGVQLLSPATK